MMLYQRFQGLFPRYGGYSAGFDSVVASDSVVSPLWGLFRNRYTQNGTINLLFPRYGGYSKHPEDYQNDL